jgi:hypothetical protein
MAAPNSETAPTVGFACGVLPSWSQKSSYLVELVSILAGELMDLIGLGDTALGGDDDMEPQRLWKPFPALAGVCIRT